jgi:hypothetical protein
VKHRKFILGQWRAARLFAVFSVVLIPLITWANLSRAIERGDPFDWRIVLLAAGLVAFAILLAEATRRWFNFMLNSDECTWRPHR